MRIGTIAFSSQTGLAYQAQSFCEHMNPTKVLIDDLSSHNGMPVDHSWAPDARIVHHNDLVRNNSWAVNEHIEWLTDDVDVIFIHETPLNHGLYVRAREKGVKTIQMTNFEFVDGYRHPDWPRPDFMAMPSSWHNDTVAELNMGQVIRWPVPVDRQKFPRRHIGHCDTFVHIIGRPTYEDRNGTMIFLDAINTLGPRYQYKIFLQEPTEARAAEFFQPVREAIEASHSPVEIITTVQTPQELYTFGDILVLPRRYGGLCLPMQEALSSGMPVIMTDISPNEFLPSEWLIPAQLKGNFFFHAPIDVYDASGTDLAMRMLSFADSTFLSDAVRKADELADSISWENLKPFYEETLDKICDA